MDNEDVRTDLPTENEKELLHHLLDNLEEEDNGNSRTSTSNSES